MKKTTGKRPTLIIGPKHSGKSTNVTAIIKELSVDGVAVKRLDFTGKGFVSNLPSVVASQCEQYTKVVVIDELYPIARNIESVLKISSTGLKLRKSRKVIHPKIIVVMCIDSNIQLDRFLPFDIMRHERTDTGTVTPIKPSIEFRDRQEVQSLSSNLADLLCWFAGFKAGTRSIEEMSSLLGIAENGINAARELNLKLKAKL
jgi:hypothetical protein